MNTIKYSKYSTWSDSLVSSVTVDRSLPVELRVEEGCQISVLASAPARPHAVVFGGRRAHAVVAPPLVDVIVPKAVVEGSVRHAADSEKIQRQHVISSRKR